MNVSRKLVGERMNIAPFGRIMYWTGSDPLTLEAHEIEPSDGVWLPVDVEEQGGPHIGVEWEHPRQFSSVVVRFRDSQPAPESVRLEYWVHSWPPRWGGGWTAIDDPFNGSWVWAHGDVHVSGDTWTFTFDPLDITEIDRAEDFAVFYRQAYRVRLLFRDGSKPAIADIGVFSDSIWREATLRIQFGLGGNSLRYGGNVDVYNGYVLSLDDSNPQSVTASILYAKTHNHGMPWTVPTPPDRTIVTVKGSDRNFSFLVTDAVEEGVYIADLGVFAGRADGKGFEAWDRERRERGIVLPIYDRVLMESEQSYERASREIPQLKATKQGAYGRYCPIGCDGNRQEFAVRYNGDIFADKRSMKVVGRDTARLLWPGSKIFYRIGSGNPPDFREREGGTEQEAYLGYLPIYTSRWKDREIEYELTTFAGLIYESPWGEEKKRGDEPIAAISRLRIRNTTEEGRIARFWVVIESPEELEVEEEGFVYAVGRGRDDRVPDSEVQKRWVVERYDKRRMRLYIDRKGRGEVKAEACTYAPYEVSGIRNGVAYDIELGARKRHEIEFVIPFVTYVGDEGREEVRKLDYEAKFAEMVEYWQSQIDAGAEISTPEPIINDYVKATIPHIGITVDKTVKSGYYILPAGTYDYQVCMNEACHQIRSLDYRGHHDRARKYLKPFLDFQGTMPMHGRFKSAEGVFHGLPADDDVLYQTFRYNLDHGFVTFALAEHYKFTRDKAWLTDIASRLVAACDFVTRERQATMKTELDGSKVLEYGLLPAGHLEDNAEWHYWYAVNAYCYRGMKAVTEALADIGHPETERLRHDTEAYRQDLRRAMRRSMELSPVERLSDGTYIPFVPTRARLRGRDVGWIRDSLYACIHAIECGVLDPNEEMSTWILKDTEDNVFVSRYRGRQVDLERFWFSQGGNTIQSGLLPIVMVYLKRDQPEHAIRALYNGLAQNLYPDVRCFTEHPVEAFGLGQGPFYKTPDENCWINWLRNILLMEPDDATLRIAPGAPRKWFGAGKEFSVRDMATYFGPVSYHVASGGDQIIATLTPPRRNPPSVLEVRLRHPEKRPIRSVQVNGRKYDAFDVEKEIVRFANTTDLPDELEVVVQY